MQVIEGSSVNAIYLEAVRGLSGQPYTQPSRNGLTAEWHPAVLRLTDLRYRSLCLPGRRKNLLLQLTEFLWIWHGANDLATVEAACAQWREYSDDGKTLYGAYGRRLRCAGIDGLDQIRRAGERLAANPGDRQCVMTIWEPKDLWAKSKDLPCNDLLHFLIRDGKLDLTVFIRSNDLHWGAPYNIFNWTQLQCVMAARIGVPPGTYTHFANSLHLYESKQSEYVRMLKACEQPAPDLPLSVEGATDAQFQWLGEQLQAMLVHGLPIETEHRVFHGLPAFWKDYLLALAAGFYMKHTGDAELTLACLELMTTPLRVEASEAFARAARKLELPLPTTFVAWAELLPTAEHAYVLPA